MNDKFKPSPIMVNNFDEADVKNFRKEISEREQESDLPIVVYIDSFGGSAYGGLAMVDTIESCFNQVVTVCTGKAMSCGAILLMAGDVRFATSKSAIMIHEVSTWAAGHIKDLKQSAEESLKLNQSVVEYMARRMKIKGGVKALDKLFASQRDLTYTASEAVNMGIIDYVGEPEIITNVTHTVAIRGKRNKL